MDERTTVFNLGRTALVLLDTGDLDGLFRGGPAMYDVLVRATHATPEQRFSTVSEFIDAWQRAIPPDGPGR